MTITKITINGVEIPLEKVCGECDGEKGSMQFYETFFGVNKVGAEAWVECTYCKGTGKQHIYYTPQQIEELTGEKLPEDTIILVLIDGRWRSEYLSTRIVWDKDYIADGATIRPRVIAFPYQPAPSADYRTEANI